MTNSASPLPAKIINALYRMRSRSGGVDRAIRFITRSIMPRRGIIRKGVGAGLKFDTTGGNLSYLCGGIEAEEENALQTFLKPGNVFYDIGANIGFYSTLAARIVGPEGAVYAFEPFPEAASAARRNALLNNFGHVRVIEAAASDHSGVASFAVGLNSVTNHLSTHQSAGEIEVPLITIDAHSRSEQNRPPTLVMVDVEGSEIAVLRGMLITIARHRPVIICEVHWILQEFYDFYTSELKPLGYDLSTLDGSPLPMTPLRYHALLSPRL